MWNHASQIDKRFQTAAEKGSFTEAAEVCYISQSPVETVLKVDLYGTAVLFEEAGKVIKQGGATASCFCGPLKP